MLNRNNPELFSFLKAFHRTISLVIMGLVILAGSVGYLLPANPPQSQEINSHGVRNGEKIDVLLINASEESTPIFQSIIEGNASYNLVMQKVNETNASEWENYSILVWAQGREDKNASLEKELKNYTSHGGRLLIEGANIAENTDNSEFEEVVLHASSIDGVPLPQNHYIGQNLVKNNTYHPVASRPHNLSDSINYQSNESNRLDSDVCQARNGSVVVMKWERITTVNGTTENNTMDYGGVFAFDDNNNLSDGGQIVFFSFSVAVLNNSTDRHSLIENALDWLKPLEESYSVDLYPEEQGKNTTSGSTVSYEITIMNNGTAQDTIQLTHSDPPDGWQADLDKDSVTLLPGENTTVNLSVTAPLNATDGEYARIYVTGTSSGDPTQNDSVLTNTTVNNEALPDLEPVWLGPLKGRMYLGRDTTINATVRNNGNIDAFGVMVNFYLDTNDTTPIGTDTIDVPAGEERNASIEWNATTYFGDHTLLVEVDPEQTQPETNESNNHLENKTGDWYVMGKVSLENGEYHLTGNLSVEGLLVLENITLLFNSTDGEYGLFIQQEVNVNNSHLSALKESNVSSFRFEVRGRMKLTNSTVSRLYSTGDIIPRGGIVIYSDEVLVFQTNITQSEMGVWTSYSPKISESVFENISGYAVYSNYGSPIITNTTFRNRDNLSTSLLLTGGNPVVRGCDISLTLQGIYIMSQSNARVLNTTIHDIYPTGTGIRVLDSSPVFSGNLVTGTNTAIYIKDSSPLILKSDLSNNRVYGIYSKDSTPIINDTVLSSNAGKGLQAFGGHITVHHTIIRNNTDFGLSLSRSWLDASNLTVMDSLTGIYSYSSEVIIANSSITSGEVDINLTHSSSCLALNSSFENVEVQSSSLLTRAFFMRVKAITRAGEDLPSAEVVVRDRSMKNVYNGITNSSGWTEIFPLIIYNQTTEGKEWHTPFRIDVYYNNGNGNTTINLTEYKEISLVVNMPPVAVLGAEVLNGTPQTIFRFSGEDSLDDSGVVSGYRFDFGDGTTTGWQSGKTATHIYERAGYYTVSLMVRDAQGAVSDPSTLKVLVNTPPAVNLPEKLNGKEGLNLSFSADVFDPDDWDNLHYTWDFGDGSISHLRSPTHAYSIAGNYTVTLTVKDDHGGMGRDTMIVDISINHPPVADAGPDINVTFNNGATVLFHSYSYDPDGDSLDFLWDFGDGSISYQMNPQHFYNSSGTFRVTLTVTDSSGASDTDIIMVNVIEYGVELTGGQTLSGRRGDNIHTTITVKNTGSHPEQINLSTEGWAILQYHSITLNPDESHQINLTVTIPYTAPMGVEEIIITAETGGRYYEASIYVDVLRDYGVSLSQPVIQSGEPGDTVLFTLTITNTGTDVDSFEITVVRLPPGWSIKFNGQNVLVIPTLGAGNSAEVMVSLHIPAGEDQGEKSATVKAISIGDPDTFTTIDIMVNVVGAESTSTESGTNTTVYGITALIIIGLIAGGFLYWRKQQGYTFAEEEEEEEEIPTPDMEEEKTSRAPKLLKCPKCGTLLEIPTDKRPVTIQCPTCGARAIIRN